ncbi:hypothetical protein KIN20_011278 [Parelaphostrongylus tenuis]|uniref:CAP-Gly domain-containing protein n=1 Tax=Parelaphostrongylus tenuis TaxID=148309 RepID=A0AAD5MDU5_PARTN|nr:hypothetical protein KIN20_011278 [Parelaphostrongylus tenuis]
MTGGHSAVVPSVEVVSGHPGLWTSVEWDNLNRGIHNGVVNGEQYFRARCGFFYYFFPETLWVSSCDAGVACVRRAYD